MDASFNDSIWMIMNLHDFLIHTHWALSLTALVWLNGYEKRKYSFERTRAVEIIVIRYLLLDLADLNVVKWVTKFRTFMRFFFLSSKIQVMTSQNWSDPHCDSIKFVIFDHSFHFQSFPAHRIWHNELTFIKYSLIFRLQFGEKQNWNHFQASKYDPDKRSNSKVRIIIEIKIVATMITFYGFKVCERVSLNSFFLF